jgi:glycosyltransferase involved in cell wall biosynthesis
VYVSFESLSNHHNILDYLLSRFSPVICIFLRSPVHPRTSSRVTVYLDGKPAWNRPLFSIRSHPRSPSSILSHLIAVTQILIYVVYLRRKFHLHNLLYFSSFPIHSLVGIFLSRSGIVDTSLRWVLDYLVPPDPSSPILERLLVASHRPFERITVSMSDAVWFVSENLSRRYGGINGKSHYLVVPFGMNSSSIGPKSSRNVIGYIGTLLRDRVSLDELISALPAVVKSFPDLRVEIVGSGPDEDALKRSVSSSGLSQAFSFRNHVFGNELNSLMSTWKVGLCLYTRGERTRDQTDPSFGVSSKASEYLGRAVPVLCVNSPQIADEIKLEDAGVVLDNDFTSEALVDALSFMLENYAELRKGAIRIAEKYEYLSLYDRGMRDSIFPAP